MPKVSELFQSRFLRAEDLGSHHVRVTIAAVTVEAMQGGKKPVIYFRDKTKGLVLNVTRARSLARVLASEDTDDWIGCSVTLYASVVRVRDEAAERRVRMICIDERPETASHPRG